MNNTIVVKAGAFLFTAAILALGYIAFGFWTAFIFTFGFFGGFLIWIFTSHQVPFQKFKLAYWLTLGFFLLHRVEEKVMGFFAKLAAITGAES